MQLEAPWPSPMVDYVTDGRLIWLQLARLTHQDEIVFNLILLMEPSCYYYVVYGVNGHLRCSLGYVTNKIFEWQEFYFNKVPCCEGKAIGNGNDLKLVSWSPPPGRA